MLSHTERNLTDFVCQIAYCNPFSPLRMSLEKQILGDDHKPEEESSALSNKPHANILEINRRITPILEKMRSALLATRGLSLQNELAEQYVDVTLFVLYHRYQEELRSFVETQLIDRKIKPKLKLYDSFVADCEYFFSAHEHFRSSEYASTHLLALAFQVARAYSAIYKYLIGISKPIQDLRARVWQSIFTHDFRSYRRYLYARMGEHATLITGPSGTGKELVARAIAFSRYIPFNPTTQSFSEDFTLSFYALNLSAFPSTLLESELFGHTRGAFTGAATDRMGWLEQCGNLGTVFLDEVGEIEQVTQVKLLRLLESREFQRLGDTRTLTFKGKIVAATNRNLTLDIKNERFRADLFYRLCADQIITPCLKERLDEQPQELETLTRFLLQRWCPEFEVAKKHQEICSWIRKFIPSQYEWPGNVRELDQCIRNLHIQGKYIPNINTRTQQTSPLPADLIERISSLEAPADELLRWYCQYAYSRLNNFEEAGRKLQLDRRTIRAKVL